MVVNEKGRGNVLLRFDIRTKALTKQSYYNLYYVDAEQGVLNVVTGSAADQRSWFMRTFPGQVIETMARGVSHVGVRTAVNAIWVAEEAAEGAMFVGQGVKAVAARLINRKDP